MTSLGATPPPRCVEGRTAFLAGTPGTGRDAPLAAILLSLIKPQRSIPLVAFLANAETGFPILLIGPDVLEFLKTAKALGHSVPPLLLAPRRRGHRITSEE